MAGGVEQYETAIDHGIGNVLTHRDPGDHVIAALQHERRGGHLAQVGAIVRKKRHRANWRAIRGSVRQKLSVSSSPSSGRSEFPMITGAIASTNPDSCSPTIQAAR